MIKKLRITYYALLRQERGLAEEIIESNAITARELYSELKAQHSFKLTENQVKVAINSKVSSWDATINADDSILFIPPVAGG